ncbi:MAG TPA: hypothetical protein VIL78_04505 [Hanamia sp.]
MLDLDSSFSSSGKFDKVSTLSLLIFNTNHSSTTKNIKKMSNEIIGYISAPFMVSVYF